MSADLERLAELAEKAGADPWRSTGYANTEFLVALVKWFRAELPNLRAKRSGRNKILEEAAKVCEDELQFDPTNGKQFAAAIRALKHQASPSPSREAVSRAVEAAKSIESYLGKNEGGELFDEARFVRETLESALKSPEPEPSMPCAWCDPSFGCFDRTFGDGSLPCQKKPEPSNAAPQLTGEHPRSGNATEPAGAVPAPEMREYVRMPRGKLEMLETAYYELLFAVGNKYPGETRHETALKYIRRAEESSQTADSAEKQGKEG